MNTEKWKLSLGTACVIGKKQIKAETLPTTAYVMIGEKCRNNCRFCSQARESKAGSNKLSRITWPTFAADEAAADIGNAYLAGKLKRVCLQVVNNGDSLEKTTSSVIKLNNINKELPICVTNDVGTVEQAAQLLAAGADKISIALDAANPTVYRQVKGGDWQKRWDLLYSCAKALPGRVATHLIVGLGESEQELINLLADCKNAGITVGLFAFTPVRGTALGTKQAPPIGQYRRCQIAHYLLRKGYNQSVFHFQEGRLVSCEVPDFKGILADGIAFETSGCPDCNRPFYNERPGGIMYNFPRNLTVAETAQAIKESEL